MEAPAKEASQGKPPQAEKKASLWPEAKEERKAFPVGAVVRGGRVLVTWSDGTTTTERDPKLQAVYRQGIDYAGEWMSYRALPRGWESEPPEETRAEDVREEVNPETGYTEETTGEKTAAGRIVRKAMDFKLLRQ